MEKTDSLATVCVNKQYAADNVSYTSEEAPPAYKQPRSAAVQVAKIAAVTVIAAAAILGGCILASAWIQTRASCDYLLMEQQLLQNRDTPSFQALVHDNAAEESRTTTEKDVPEEQQKENSVQFNKVPIHLNFDDLTGSMLDNNQRAHMNCVMEKRRSEELVDHAPRQVSLPFGLNLTTPPRLEHLTGEKMIISCSSDRAEEKTMPVPTSTQPPQLPKPIRGVPLPMMIPVRGAPIPFFPDRRAYSHFDEHRNPMEHIEVIMAEPVSAEEMPEHEQRPQMPQHLQMPQHPQMPQPLQRPQHPMMSQHPMMPQHPQIPQHPPMPRPQEIRMARMHEEPIPQESMRPHFVQPRSVNSQPDFLSGGQKRMKRCACDCNC